MTTVVSSLLAAVVALSAAANAAPAAPAGSAAMAAYYYEPIVPYGPPYPAPGYVVSTYVPPQYAGYSIVAPAPYRPRKTDYDKDKYDTEEPKYYYGGKFNGNRLHYSHHITWRKQKQASKGLFI